MAEYARDANVKALAEAFGADQGDQDDRINAAQPYASRAQAEAAAIPPTAQYINVAGLQYVRDPSGTALETAGGVKWSPATSIVDLGHFGVVYNDRNVDNKENIQRAIFWCAPRGRKLYHSGGEVTSSGPIYLCNATFTYVKWEFTGAGKDVSTWVVKSDLASAPVFMTTQLADGSIPNDAMDNKTFGGWTFVLHEDVADAVTHPVAFSLGINGNTTIRDMRALGFKNTKFDIDTSYNLRMEDTVSWHGGISFLHKVIPSTVRFTVSNDSDVVSVDVGNTTGDPDVFDLSDVGREFAVANFVRGIITEVVSAQQIKLSATSFVPLGRPSSDLYGTFGACKISTVAESTTITADGNCFVPEHEGLWIIIPDGTDTPVRAMRAKIVSVTSSNTAVLNRAPTATLESARFGVPTISLHNENNIRMVEDGRTPRGSSNDVRLLDNWVELGGGVCLSIVGATKFLAHDLKLHGDYEFGSTPTQSCLWASNVEGYLGASLFESFTTDSVVYVSNQNDTSLVIDSPQAIVPKGKPLVEVGSYSGWNPPYRGSVEVTGTVRVTNAIDHELFFDPNPSNQKLLHVPAMIKSPNRRFIGDKGVLPAVYHDIYLRGSTGPVLVDQNRPSPYTKTWNMINWFPNFMTFLKGSIDGADTVQITLPESLPAATNAMAPASLQGEGNTQLAEGIRNVHVTITRQSPYATLWSPSLNRLLVYSDLPAGCVLRSAHVVYLI